MARIVQKFGGSSVANSERIKQAAKIAVDAAKQGDEIIVVVSAMGDTTDQLIALAKQFSNVPNIRELDMLLATGEQQAIAVFAMAVQELGMPARSFTGTQAGILTDGRYGVANIEEIKPIAIEACLNRGEIAIVAGFQGVTAGQELTTLGRDGSDTTAVALANVLGAERCDIYKDVNGVFTADPHILQEAKRLSSLSYEEMLELSQAGTRVMTYKSVELAMINNLPVRIRSTFCPEDPGTLITHKFVTPDYLVSGITCDTTQVLFNLKFPPVHEEVNVLESVSSFFTRLNELAIPTDMTMILTREDEPLQELSFVVERNFSPRVEALVQSIWLKQGPFALTMDDSMARISIVSRAFSARPDVVAAVFETLNQATIPVQMVTTSELRMSVLMPTQYAHQAVKLIHDRFNMLGDLKAA